MEYTNIRPLFAALYELQRIADEVQPEMARLTKLLEEEFTKVPLSKDGREKVYDDLVTYKYNGLCETTDHRVVMLSPWAIEFSEDEKTMTVFDAEKASMDYAAAKSGKKIKRKQTEIERIQRSYTFGLFSSLQKHSSLWYVYLAKRNKIPCRVEHLAAVRKDIPKIKTFQELPEYLDRTLIDTYKIINTLNMDIEDLHTFGGVALREDGIVLPTEQLEKDIVILYRQYCDKFNTIDKSLSEWQVRRDTDKFANDYHEEVTHLIRKAGYHYPTVPIFAPVAYADRVLYNERVQDEAQRGYQGQPYTIGAIKRHAAHLEKIYGVYLAEERKDVLRVLKHVEII